MKNNNPKNQLNLEHFGFINDPNKLDLFKYRAEKDKKIPEMLPNTNNLQNVFIQKKLFSKQSIGPVFSDLHQKLIYNNSEKHDKKPILSETITNIFKKYKVKEEEEEKEENIKNFEPFYKKKTEPSETLEITLPFGRNKIPFLNSNKPQKILSAEEKKLQNEIKKEQYAAILRKENKQKEEKIDKQKQIKIDKELYEINKKKEEEEIKQKKLEIEAQKQEFEQAQNERLKELDELTKVLAKKKVNNYHEFTNMVNLGALISKKSCGELYHTILTREKKEENIKMDVCFSNTIEYIRILKGLFLKEVTYQINGTIEEFLKFKNIRTSGKIYRLRILKETCGQDFLFLELEETSLKREKSENNANVVDEFDISFSKNYLILLTNIGEITDFSLLKDKLFRHKSAFMILGILLDEKCGPNSKKVLSLGDRERFSKFFNSKEGFINVSLLPVEKLITIQREFQAIQAISQIDLIQDLTTTRISSNYEPFTLNMNSILLNLKKIYNESQYQSISNIIKSSNRINLLQGPPGTGKTHTLIGLLSALYTQIKFDPNNHKKYIFICAPSNAAIDEIITRIKQDGIIDASGKRIQIKIVRVGVLDKNPSEIVKSVALEHAAQKILFQEAKKSNENISIIDLRVELDKIRSKIDLIKEKNDEESKRTLTLLFEKRRQIIFQIIDSKQNKAQSRERYKQILDQLLMEAEVICSTLSSSGSEKLDFFKNQIDVLIVDEASQATEPASLIPMQFSPSRIILIGDPKQLPATTFSPDVNETFYNRSLFERLLEAGREPFFLDIQYRMHPNIRDFPSKMFYGNKLKDSESVKERKMPIFLKNFEGNNLLFIDVSFGKESKIDYSFRNEMEAKLSFEIANEITKRINNYILDKKDGKLGFISPYKAQINYFKNLVKQKYGNKANDIQINTVDSFQGQEKDVIIFSTVRSSVHSGIGFLKDLRRLNVAITRAKFVLIIIGNSTALIQHPVWHKMLENFQRRNYIINLPAEKDISTFINFLMEDPNNIPQNFTNFHLPPFRDLKRQKNSEQKFTATKIDNFDCEKKNREKKVAEQILEDNTFIEKSYQIEEGEINLPIPEIKINKISQNVDTLELFGVPKGLFSNGNSALQSLISNIELKKENKIIEKSNVIKID